MANYGEKLKGMRLACGFTQEELGNRCDLSKGYISQLENDLNSPSIATLTDILSALGSDLRTFFTDDEAEQIVFRDEDFFEKTDGGHKIEWLVPNAQKNEMEPTLQEVAAGQSTTKDMPHEGEEFGYILEGAATLHFGKRILTVNAGESFYFVASKVHFIENAGKGRLRLIWVASPPNF